jgi:hypothetical protein
MTQSVSHKWRFFRSGGFDQVVLASGADLQHLASLDQKLWTVLNCPTQGLEFDPATTALLDTDGDGQIRVPEILAAVRWCCARLRDADIMFGEPGILVSMLDPSDAEGQTLKAAAERVLDYLGKAADGTLQVSDFVDTTKLYAADHFNGDGVVVGALTQDPELHQLLGEMVAALGGVVDRSGVMGVNQALLDQFYQQAHAVVAWHTAGQTNDKEIWPLGDNTAAAVAAYERVQSKVDDYFVRCRLAAFDARAAASLNPDTAVYGSLANRNVASLDSELTALPLATIVADASLPLRSGLNPAWAAAVASLQSQVIEPLLGQRDELSAADWAQIGQLLTPWRSWQAQKPQNNLHALGLERIQAIVAGDGQAQLSALIAEDLMINSFAENVRALERLCRYQRDLVTLLRNYVSLSDFYQRRGKAIFQAGTLYIDQRSCELVMRVHDAAKHASTASFSGCYLLYCQCTRQGESPLQIVAALTAGDVDYSMAAGRNGIFYDRQGRDWNATVTKVVAQPISIRQAFWSPYRRLAAFIESQLNKFAASRDKDIEAQTAAGVTDVAASKTESKSSFDIAKFAGIFAAIGLAVGAIGTALAALASGFFALSIWQMPLVMVGAMLLVSGPSIIMAAITLRRRNLGPLLDANGWAMNTRAIINIPFGGSLTGVAALPPGAQRSLVDPFAAQRKPWGLLMVVAAAAATAAYLWWFGNPFM